MRQNTVSPLVKDNSFAPLIASGARERERGPSFGREASGARGRSGEFLSGRRGKEGQGTHRSRVGSGCRANSMQGAVGLQSCVAGQVRAVEAFAGTTSGSGQAKLQKRHGGNSGHLGFRGGEICAAQTSAFYVKLSSVVSRRRQRSALKVKCPPVQCFRGLAGE